MRRVIGIGETILDILFKNNQPTVAVPGGSVFNGLVSLGRAGANVTFISEVGGDRVGDIILNFMKDNGISTDSVVVYPERKSPISFNCFTFVCNVELNIVSLTPARMLKIICGKTFGIESYIILNV